jgi:catechol 2,3-dioxygenase-like lactoylglutathione lyase family enzyme
MQVANKLMMLAVNVGDMAKSKAFYAEKLGFEIATEYRQDDNNWWVTLTLPEGGATITLSRASVSPESVKSGTLAAYFETSDVDTAHKQLADKGVDVEDVQNDLFGPGSDVKWFNAKDPDGNVVFFAQKHDARAPF